MSANERFLGMDALEAGLERIAAAPKDLGRLELIVRRPGVGEREVLPEGRLDPRHGLVGDSWLSRGSRRTPDGSAHPDMQVALISARLVDLLTAGDRSRWSLSGDQLYVDLDLGSANLPAGSTLQIGAAVLEITGQPHTGCDKFAAWFGEAARLFVNAHMDLRLRGVYARVIEPGTVKPGEAVKVIQRAAA